MPPTRVLIYGDSLMLASVRAILEQLPAIEIVPSKPKPDAHELSTAAVQPSPPDTVLFDVERANLPVLLAAFHHIPALRLIGLDGASQSALVVQGQSRSIVMPDDLTQLILER